MVGKEQAPSSRLLAEIQRPGGTGHPPQLQLQRLLPEGARRPLKTVKQPQTEGPEGSPPEEGAEVVRPTRSFKAPTKGSRRGHRKQAHKHIFMVQASKLQGTQGGGSAIRLADKGGGRSWGILAGLRAAQGGKESVCKAGDAGEAGSVSGSGRSPGGGDGNPLQGSGLGTSHRQSPVGYSPWGCKGVRHD